MRIRKRLFVSLLGISLLVLTGMAVAAWHLVVNRDLPLYNMILGILGGFLLVVTVVVGLGLAGLVLTLWRDKTYPSLQNLMLVTTNLLFPVALVLGRAVGISVDTIKSSFIEVNNQLVGMRIRHVPPEEVLILAPHCLQDSGCKYKITLDVHNCRRCGRCPVNDLHNIADKYQVKLVIATGGTLARRLVQQIRPRAIVAIACERDLTSGIQDTNPLPVLGVLNIRPEGPCFNTNVNLGKVEEAVKSFLAGSRRPVDLRDTL